MHHDDPNHLLQRRISEGAFAGLASRRKIPAGELWLGSDDEDEADGLLFVRSGCLRAFVSRDGRELTLFVLGTGDTIRVRAGSTLEARRDSEIVFVPMKAIRDLARTDPELLLWAMPVLDKLLERSLRLVEDMVFADVKHRLIRVLCDTADREGRRGDDGIVLTSPPNAEDLATEIGATRQSVSTVMADLARSGILRRFGQRSMVISDIGRLRRELRAGEAC
jgi:CRP-like cAMP-binding protein